jgi:hypothetical protein
LNQKKQQESFQSPRINPARARITRLIRMPPTRAHEGYTETVYEVWGDIRPKSSGLTPASSAPAAPYRIRERHYYGDRGPEVTLTSRPAGEVFRESDAVSLLSADEYFQTYGIELVFRQEYRHVD